MDLKTLKLELLERIALIDDEARLKALKRLLDAPLGYGIPNEKLSVVHEEEAPYLKLEDRMYSVQEVHTIIHAVREEYEAVDLDDELSSEQVAELDRRHAEMKSGKVKGIPWEEVQRLLDEDRKRDRA